MATFFEPRWHAREREARDRERYWELEFSDLDELLRIDRANLRDGLPLTSFGQALLETYARAGVPLEERRAIEAETRRELLERASQPVEVEPVESLAGLGAGVGGFGAASGAGDPRAAILGGLDLGGLDLGGLDLGASGVGGPGLGGVALGGVATPG